MKRILSILSSTAVTAASLAGYASGDQSSQAKTSQPVSSAAPEFTVDRIGATYVKSPLNIPSIIEKEQGVFTKASGGYGLPVEYSNLTAGLGQIQALASGGIQFLYAAGATPVILFTSSGTDTKIISVYSRSPEAFHMFAGKDSKIQSATDLKGKKVTGLKDTTLHELMVAYLATTDLTEKNVEFVSMGIPNTQAALVGGTIDCALLTGLTAYSMEKDGCKIVITGKGFVDATIVVATSQSSYDRNPLLIKRFLEAQDQIASYVKEDSEKILEMTTKETELSIDAVKKMCPMYNFSTEVTDADITSVKRTEQFTKENAVIEDDTDFDQLILKVK